MRFILGVLLGAALGYAAATMLAPEKRSRAGFAWPEGGEETGGEAAPSGNGARGVPAGVQKVMRSVQERVSEAMAEARRASSEAEKELRAEYERTVHRPSSRRGGK